MVWYKAWLESRSRFLLSALAIISLCVFFVVYQEGSRAAFAEKDLSYIGYIWRITYRSGLRELFELMAVVLGLGGLLRERERRTAGFTLALPVTRWSWTQSRAVVGLAEVAVLSTLPALVLPAISPLVHQSYPFHQAIQFSLLWLIGGTLFFSVAFLLSVVCGGEYGAPLVSLTVFILYSIFVEVPSVERFIPDVHDIMSGAGMSYFRSDISMLIGPLPWATLSSILLIGLGFLAAASYVTGRQDF